MSLLFIDPFEGYKLGAINSSDAKKLGGFLINNRARQPSIVNGTVSNKALRIYTGTGTYSWGNFVINVSIAGIMTIGFVYKANIPFFGSSRTLIMSFTDSSHKDGELIINNDWSLSLGSLTTPSDTIQLDIYALIEITFNSETGEFELFINNKSLGTGVFTYKSNGVKQLLLGGWYDQSNHYHYYDDIYVLNDQGETFNKRLGFIRVTNLPLLSSTETNFVPNTEISNLDIMNDTTFSNTNYVTSPEANGLGDFYKIDTSSLPEDLKIHAIQQNVHFRKSDLGSRALRLKTKYGDDSLDKIATDKVFDFGLSMSNIMPTAPDGSSWDHSKLSDVEIGYETALHTVEEV